MAAVIGNRFDIGVLARAYGQSIADTAVALALRHRRRAHRAAVGPRERRPGRAAIPTRLQAVRVPARPRPTGRVCDAGGSRTARAAPARSDAPRSPTRLRRQLESRLFDIISHLNQGRALIEDAAERQRLAELNFRAGTKARDSTAYDLAVLSFRTAIELSGENGWRDRYAFHYDAHRRLAEASGLTADHAGAFAVIEQALEHAASLTDRAHLYGIKTNVLLIVGRIPEALACGREAVRLFGVDWPDDPDQVRALLQSEIRTILEQTAAIGIENLLDLPPMQDPDTLALMPLLTYCLPAAYQSDQESYALLCCTMVRLSLAARQLCVVDASVRLVRRVDQQRARRLQRRLPIRQARRRSGAQAQRDLGAFRRVLPVGDVRVALEQAGRREHRALSALHRVRAAERRPLARGLRRGTPLLAPAVPRHCRSPSCARTATPRWVCCTESTTPPTPSSWGRACGSSTGSRASGATATRSAATLTTRAHARPRSRRAAIARSSRTGS